MQQNQGSPNVSNIQLTGMVENTVIFMYLWQYRNLPIFQTQSTREVHNNNISHYYYEFLHKLHEIKLFGISPNDLFIS